MNLHPDEIEPSAGFAQALADHLATSARLLTILLVLIGGVGFVWYMCQTPLIPGQTRENTARRIRELYGLQVEAEELLYVTAIPRHGGFQLARRDIVFIGRGAGQEHGDVYRATVKVSTRGIPLHVTQPVNLTRSPRVDESLLVAQNGRVAFFTPGRWIHILSFDEPEKPCKRSFKALVGRAERAWRYGRPVPPKHLRFATSLTRVALRWKEGTLEVAPPHGVEAPYRFYPSRHTFSDGTPRKVQLVSPPPLTTLKSAPFRWLF